jgi:hypothetical protein
VGVWDGYILLKISSISQAEKSDEFTSVAPLERITLLEFIS